MPFIFGVVGAAAQGTRRSSGGGGVSYGTITGYYNNTDSALFCSSVGNIAVTVYYSGSGTKTFTEAYNSGSVLFSNTSLTTSASAGIYGSADGGRGNTWVDWRPNRGGWNGTGVC